MPTFAYKCLDANGSPVTGAIDAVSLDSANSVLLEKGYIPLEVKSSRGAAKSKRNDQVLTFFSKKVPTIDIILFTKQMRAMLSTGMPIVSILEILQEQTENESLELVISTMVEDLKGGKTLHAAFSRHPRVFSLLYCSMVRAGEISGTLQTVLDRVSYIIEHEYKVQKDVRSAMLYPAFIIIAISGAFFFLLTVVMPKFATIFENAGVALPLPTKMTIFLYELISQYWYYTFGTLAALGVSLYFYLQTDDGRYRRDALLLALPIIGKVLVKSVNSRFSSVFAILQASGVNIIDSMNILSGTMGNYAIGRELDQLRDQIEEGRGLATPLRSAKYFTPMLVNMVAVGEKSGNLEEMLEAIAAHYDDEVEYATKGLTDALVPILTLGLAVVVGFFALAIFMPMWELSTVVK